MTMDRSLIDPEQQVAAWDTIMAAQAPSYDPIQYTSSVESVPANIDIPQQEYVPDAADTYSYASPAPEYQPTYTPGPSLADVTAQEYEQYSAPDFSYQPEQGGSYYSAGTPFDASPVVQYDPSIYQQFGYGGTGEGGLTDQQAADLMFGRTQPEAFFQNPQYAESNAQFDYTTDPANRNGVGILGGLTNVIGAGLTAGTEAASALRALPMTYSVPGAPGQTITAQGNVGQGIDALDLPSDYAAQQTVNLLGDNPYGRTAAAGVNALLDPLTIAGGAVGGAGLAANLVGRGELGLLPYAASSFGAGAASQGAAELGASPGVQMLAGALGGVGGAVAPGLIADAARGLPRGSYGAILGPTGSEDDAARQVMRDLEAVTKSEDAASIYPRLAGESDLEYAVRLRQSGLPANTIKAIEQGGAPAPAAAPDVVAKLRTSIDEARPLSATTADLQSAERSRRVAISESILQRGGYTPEAYDAARAAQGGPLPRVAFESVTPNFTPEEVQGLRQNVIDVFRADAKTAGHSLYYTEANALDALGKVLGGQLDELRPSDIGLLDHVFGREVSTSIVAKISREAGIRGGVHWPIAGLDFSDESKSIIQQFIDNAVGTDTLPLKSVDDLKSALRVDLGIDQAQRTPGIIENIKDRPWRGITSKIGGDLADPIATEMVTQEDQLYRAILKAEVDKIAHVNLDGLSEADRMWAKADEFLQAQEAMNKAREATRLYRNEVFNSIDDAARKRELFKALAQSDISRDVAHNAALKKLADAQAPLKEIMLSADFGVALQQGSRGVRMGASSALTSAVAKAADSVASVLGKDVDSFGIYPNPLISHRAAAQADGLILRGSASVGIERDFASAASDRLLGQKLNLKTPFRVARKGLEKLSDVQYGLLDKFRLQVYEGRLIQEKLLGNNIADPAVRRAIADFANTAGSTARTATNQARREAERGLLLSPQLTRAQFAEIAQPLKTFTSRTQATNTLNYMASMAATFGLAYAVQSQFGPEMSMEEFISRSADPTKTTFGRLLIGAKDNAKVTDFLPQFSLERAVLKSVVAASDGDLKKIGDTWTKFGVGRLNVLPSGALNLAGVGYGKDGEFFYGDMPLEQRAIGAAPIPLGVENAVIEGQNDATSIALNTLGGNVYPESPTAERARTDPQLQAAIDLYWGAYDQALNIVKSENLASGPYAPLLEKAKDYDQLRYMIDMVVAEAQKDDPRINKNAATQAILKELGVTQTAQEVRKAAVRRNPAVIQYLTERGDDIPKYLWDAYDETQAGK